MPLAVICFYVADAAPAVTPRYDAAPLLLRFALPFSATIFFFFFFFDYFRRLFRHICFAAVHY